MADSSDAVAEAAVAEASSNSEDLAKFLKTLKSMGGIKALLPKFTMEGAKYVADLFSKLESSALDGQGRVSRALFRVLEQEALENGVLKAGEKMTQYEKDLEKLRALEDISLTALFARLRELIDNYVETFEPEISNIAGSGPTRQEALILLESGGIISAEQAFGFLKHPESFLPLVPEELLAKWRERNPVTERSRRPAAKRRRADSKIEDFSKVEVGMKKIKKDDSQAKEEVKAEDTSSWGGKDDSQWGDWDSNWYKNGK